MGSTTSKEEEEDAAAMRSGTDNLPATAQEAVQGLDLSGQTVLVTGAYSGLGAASTRAFLSVQAKVIVAGRNATLQKEFCKVLAQEEYPPDQIDGSHTLDLSDLASVQEFATYVKQTYPTIDVLMLNAGIMNTPYGLTKQGLEMQMGVNAVGHFLLAKILADQTKRQVWVSSRGHSLWQGPPMASNFDNEKAPRIDIAAIDNVDKGTYDNWMRYQQSKLANILLAKQFEVQYSSSSSSSSSLETAAIQPGFVQTNLFRHMNPMMTMIGPLMMRLQGRVAQTPEQGARTQTMVAVLPSSKWVQGAYYGDCVLNDEAAAAKNMDDAKALYDYCDQVTREYQT